MPRPQVGASECLNAGERCQFHYYASADEAARKRPILFFIPSLVNKHYILDLRPEASMVKYMNQQGFDCVVLEWPVPTEQDSHMTTADYVLLLMEHLQRHWGKLDRPLVAVGYCMGGLPALALAQLFPRVQGLVLLATPWDFKQYPLADLEVEQAKMLEEWVSGAPLFSHESIQMLMYIASPYRLYLRFSRFAQEQDAERIASFVAQEHWANDGIPVTQAVARECLIDWPRNETLKRGLWDVAGEKITPDKINIPTFLAVPQQDYIVPPEVSLPLGSVIAGATIHRPQAGHVGMIAGLNRMQLWEPLAAWLQRFG